VTYDRLENRRGTLVSGETGKRRRFTRGGFLKAGGAAVASVGVGSVAHAAAGGGAARDSLAHLRRATYEPLLRSTFHVQHPHGAIDAELTEVTGLTPARKEGEAFSLVFETKRDERITQGTYTLKHPAMGTFSLFLVPIGKARRGYQLETVVNRLEA
jgi:hypothetical protein